MLRIRCTLEHGNPKGWETLPALTPESVLLARLRQHTAPDRQKKKENTVASRAAVVDLTEFAAELIMFPGGVMPVLVLHSFH